MIDLDSIIVDAKSGLSGAGKGLSDASHFVNVVDNMSMYKINSHQHIPEIAQQLKIWNSNFQALQFSTSLIPVSRGIFVSSYAKVVADFDFETIKTVLTANPPHSAFVRRLPSPPIHIRTQSACSPTKAYFSDKVKLPVMMTVGKTCACAAAPCPPGIPLIMPGETITIDAARTLRDKGVTDISVTV